MKRQLEGLGGLDHELGGGLLARGFSTSLCVSGEATAEDTPVAPSAPSTSLGSSKSLDSESVAKPKVPRKHELSSHPARPSASHNKIGDSGGGTSEGRPKWQKGNGWRKTLIERIGQKTTLQGIPRLSSDSAQPSAMNDRSQDSCSSISDWKLEHEEKQKAMLGKGETSQFILRGNRYPSNPLPVLKSRSQNMEGLSEPIQASRQRKKVQGESAPFAKERRYQQRNLIQLPKYKLAPRHVKMNSISRHAFRKALHTSIIKLPTLPPSLATSPSLASGSQSLDFLPSDETSRTALAWFRSLPDIPIFASTTRATLLDKAIEHYLGSTDHLHEFSPEWVSEDIRTPPDLNPAQEELQTLQDPIPRAELARRLLHAALHNLSCGIWLSKNSLYHLTKSIDIQGAKSLYCALHKTENDTVLRTYTDFGNRFAREGEIDLATEIFGQLCEYGVDVNQPRMLILSFHILDYRNRRNSAFSDTDLLKFMLARGITPDKRIYNALLLNSVRRGDHPSGWHIVETMVESNIEVDKGTYSILLNNAKKHMDSASVRRVMESVGPNVSGSQHYIGTDHLHLVFLLYKQNQKLGGTREGTAFEVMLPVYCQYFAIEPLLFCVPSLAEILPGMNIEQRGKARPQTPTMGVMFNALIDGITSSEVLHSVYERFRFSAQSNDPQIAGCLDDIRFYQSFIRKFGLLPDGLHMCPTILQDMLKTKTMWRKPAHWARSTKKIRDIGRAIPYRPIPNVHTWRALLTVYMFNKQPHAAEKVLELMTNRGIELDKRTYEVLVKGHAEQLNGVMKTVGAIDRMFKAGFDPEEAIMMANREIPYFDRRGFFEALEALKDQWDVLRGPESSVDDCEVGNVMDVKSLEQQENKATSPFEEAMVASYSLPTEEAKDTVLSSSPKLEPDVEPISPAPRSLQTKTAIISSYPPVTRDSRGKGRNVSSRIQPEPISLAARSSQRYKQDLQDTPPLENGSVVRYLAPGGSTLSPRAQSAIARRLTVAQDVRNTRSTAPRGTLSLQALAEVLDIKQNFQKEVVPSTKKSLVIGEKSKEEEVLDTITSSELEKLKPKTRKTMGVEPWMEEFYGKW